MKRFRLLGALTIVVLGMSLAGCGSIPLLKDKKIDYKSAGTLPPLEVPPDLTAPAADDRYAIPGGGASSGTTFSAYSKQREGVPQQGQSDVLPAVKNVQVERAGSERWLVVQGTPDQIWPVVKDFWQSLGFIIKTENPQAGVMETDWAENRAKIPDGPIRNFLGKILDSVYSTAERDKFRTRLEPGKEPGTTEIYISHRGMYEVIKGGDGGDSTVWEPMPPDPGLEAEMLRRLMVSFGVNESQAKAMVAAKPEEVRAKIVKAPSGAMSLALDDEFDRAWRRVGLALDRVGFTVEDRDRSKGLYYVRYVDPDTVKPEDSGFLSKLAFWRSKSSKDQEVHYRVLVKESGNGSVVEVLGKNGEPVVSETAGKIIALLYEQLK